jgi:hypothetical protein
MYAKNETSLMQGLTNSALPVGNRVGNARDKYGSLELNSVIGVRQIDPIDKNISLVWDWIWLRRASNSVMSARRSGIATTSGSRLSSSLD